MLQKGPDNTDHFPVSIKSKKTYVFSEYNVGSSC